MEQALLKPILEAALLAAGQPLTIAQLSELFDEDGRPTHTELAQALEALAADCAGRGVELVEVASGFRFQVRANVHAYVARLWTERQSKYSRALLETLALIAYRQPITRAEIEAVRGVAVNPNIVRTLMERNWVRVVGHRDVPGHPELLGTTKEFLDYFGLRSLDQLPSLAELRAMSELAPQFELPGTADAAGETSAPEDDVPDVVETEGETDGEEEDLDAAVDGKPGLVAAPPDAEP